MKWANKKPIEPGWYPFKGPFTAWEVVFIDHDGLELYLTRAKGWKMGTYLRNLPDSILWSEPIEEPML